MFWCSIADSTRGCGGCKKKIKAGERKRKRCERRGKKNKIKNTCGRME